MLASQRPPKNGLSIFNYIVSSRCQSCCRHKSYKVSIFRPLLWCVFGPLFIIYIPALSMFSQTFYWLFRNAFLPHFHSLAPQSPCRLCSATLIYWFDALASVKHKTGPFNAGDWVNEPPQKTLLQTAFCWHERQTYDSREMELWESKGILGIFWT